MSSSDPSDRSDLLARSAQAARVGAADLAVGQVFSLEHCFDGAAVDAFARLSGDYSPLHIDPAYAAETEFGGRVVHGLLLASLFSTLVGMQVPGRAALYLGQELNFRRPVLVGETVVASAKIVSLNPVLGVLQLATTVTKADGSVAVTGAGKVKLRDTPAAGAVAAPVPAAASTSQARVALVTGAARGIGAAIARRLAKDGYAVVVNYRASAADAARVVGAIEEEGGSACAIRADVTDDEAAIALLHEVRETFGSLSLLVNNAAPGYDIKPALETPWSDVAGHIDASVRAPYRLCLESHPLLKASGGAIINILSQVVDGAPPARAAAYVVGKYGLLGLTRALAAEWAGDGIRVNGVAPGLVETDMTSHLTERMFKLEANRTPLRRLATVADVAAAVSYLAGAGAAFLTGLVLPVSGGQVMK